jgi:outer membrane protein OmpA-like peptidoglycan-associated protein
MGRTTADRALMELLGNPGNHDMIFLKHGGLDRSLIGLCHDGSWGWKARLRPTGARNAALKALLLVSAIVSGPPAGLTQSLPPGVEGSESAVTWRAIANSNHTQAVRGVPESQQFRAARPSRPAIPPIEGRAVREPLQRTSTAFQLLRRKQLQEEMNRVLPTRDTPQGLVVTLSNSLVPDGRTVPAETAQKLARIVEIIPPDVGMRVEAYTEERRTPAETHDNSYGIADAVRDVLVDNDNSPRSIAATGFVSNAYRPGRPRRCVQIVISGQGIGNVAVLDRTAHVEAHSTSVLRGGRERTRVQTGI